MSRRLYDAYDSVIKMKCLQCYQQYLNVSTPPRLLLKKNLSHHHHRNNLNLISPGLFIQPPSTTTTFLHPTPVDNNNFPFGINWNNFSQSQLSKPLGTCSPGIFLSMDAN